MPYFTDNPPKGGENPSATGEPSQPVIGDVIEPTPPPSTAPTESPVESNDPTPKPILQSPYAPTVGPPVAPKSRTPRPQGMQMPSPPVYQRTNSFQSPSLMQGGRVTTPTGSEQSPNFSPLASGPLSPGSANMGQNSFIFPIRSVFQGITQSESSQSIASPPAGDAASPSAALNRTPSTGQSGHGRSPSKQVDPRKMSNASMYEENTDAGLASIEQLLQGGGQPLPLKTAPPPKAQATFTGRTDRTISGSHVPTRDDASPAPSDGPLGFFSAPILERESGESAFFGGRRASDAAELQAHGVGQSPKPPTQPSAPDASDTPKSRPSPRQQDPTTTGTTPKTSKQPSPLPQNPSATTPGSGLPQADKPAAGQPQERVTGINYSNRPKEDTGERTTFSTAGHAESSKRRPPAAPPAAGTTPATATKQAELVQPKPRNVGTGGLEGLTKVTRATGTRDSASSAVEVDASGEQNLINDFTGIVRLGGSLPSTAGTGNGGSGRGDAGTGTASGTGAPSGVGPERREGGERKGSRSKSQASVGSSAPSHPPTVARLAQQDRHNKASLTRSTVQDFVNQQARTVNLPDPNAPTPAPGQMREDRDEGATPGDATPIEGAVSGDTQEWSESSLSVREESEMATAASGDDAAGEGSIDEPIVTFRFEHVQTEDGHHVVAGREGQLQKCEDEPITTPGAVQGFGVLIVLEEDFESGHLTVRQVSENSTELLGLSPRYLFRLDCFTRILTDDQEDILRDNIEYLPDGEEGRNSIEDEGPQVFLLSGFGEPGSDDADEDETTASNAGRRREWTCWVAAHRPKLAPRTPTDSQGNAVSAPEVIVLEFELERDLYNPLMQTFEPAQFSSGSETPDSGSQTTISAGSNRRPDSSNSGDMSLSSMSTTVGSTPRPPLGQHGSGSDNQSMTTARPSSDSLEPSSSGRPSSKVPRGMEPMGLEGIEVEMPLERIIESTTNHAKPLRALERMRGAGSYGGSGGGSGTDSGSGPRSGRSRRPQRRQTQASNRTGTMDVFAVLGQINDQLGQAPDLETFLKITVGVVQDLCRFHRVLIYQFDESFNGQVVAELVEWGKTTDLYKGLMFPAADIPAQARQLYMINKVRLLYDRSKTTARMVLRSKEDLEFPLDMTHCFLRAMSPIHIKYLANMHVRSSMSISIMAFGQLWGLIACHSYGHHGMRVSFPVRQMLRILSDSISKNIERLSYAQRLHTRKLISTIPSQAHPTGYIVSNADDLLQVFDADAGLLVIGDGCKLLGHGNEQGQAMLAIAEFLRIMRFDNMKSSNHLARDFPDLVLPRAQDTIAGLLYVPLTAKAGQDFIVFLRKGQVREVQWAGKPYKDEKSGEQASLEPRKSFKMWSEIVTGRSRVWTDDQLESAGVLALIYGKFIQVWREKQSAMASNQLTAILLSNTSHAVRTPLSQIINTLELALAGNIDAETRNMLENSHQASRALLFHVHDLLDLTRIETGNEQSFNDPFDLRQSINDAVRLYQTESARRGLEFKVNMAPNLPPLVIGDSRKIKTVISNLVANSVKFTEHGYIEVYCGLQQGPPTTPGGGGEVIKSGYVPIEIVISDTGVGIPTDKLEAMFVTLEGAEELKSMQPTGLGLGLAVVARIVEQLQGQLRAESEVGVGTRFFFTLQMLSTDGSTPSRGGSDNSAIIGRRARTGSSGSGGSISLRSSQSAGVSEIDSFVHDFGASHMLAPVAADDRRLREAEERMNKPGTFPVTDSSWPVRPSKMDGDTDPTTISTLTSPRIGGGSSTFASPNRPSAALDRRLSYGRPGAAASPAISGAGHKLRSALTNSPPVQSSPREPPHGLRSKKGPNGEQRLKVMVVEDDAINSQILCKRLRMDKHWVVAVTNGQEGVDYLQSDWDIDAVLMDIQMPIMDGRTAAKEIRKLEQGLILTSEIDPLRIDGRIPIFAVSASLYESDRWSLAEDFDGWLLKPLDFARVRVLLKALENPGARSEEVYVQGHWERGGYLRDAISSPSPAPSPSVGV